MGNKAWVTLCATCGVIMKWNHDAYSERGPDCGHHREDAENALRYRGSRAYIHHGFEMSTPERPYRVERSIIAALRKKRRLHQAHPDIHEPLTPQNEAVLKQYRILSPAYREQLAVARRPNYATPSVGSLMSSHNCIYCMKHIPAGGGASIWVVKNGLDEMEDHRRYNERCDFFGRVINRASVDSIYRHANKATETDKDSVETSTGGEEELALRRQRRQEQSTTLELVRLCGVDWRNVRMRMFYDSTTVPFLEDLFRWIDSKRRKKVLHSAHWGRRIMNHQHYYRHENRMAARAAPTKFITL